MAIGSEQSEHVVSAPFPAEAFSLATSEMQGGLVSELDSLPVRGPYSIVHGEYTLVLLREPDHGRPRLALATRTPEGRLIVRDHMAVALEFGDEKAASARHRRAAGVDGRKPSGAAVEPVPPRHYAARCGGP